MVTDSKHLIITTYPRSGEQLQLINADGSNQHLLPTKPSDSEAAWSPDGKQIAFVSNRSGDEEIYSMQPDGSAQKRLTFIAGSDHWPPSWSSDRKRLAFTSDGTNNQPHVYVMNADGTGLTRLQSESGFDAFPAFQPESSSMTS